MPLGGNYNNDSNSTETSNYWWNMNHPEKENYSLTLQGWVVEVHEVLSTYQGQVSWFPQNKEHPEWGIKPKLSWELVILTDDGQEIHWSEGKHKDIWKYVWTMMIMSGEPDVSERDKKNKLPGMLAGAYVTFETDPKEKWKSQARPYRFKFFGQRDESLFRGVFEDWKTDPRYLDSEEYRLDQELRGVAAQRTQAAIQSLEVSNPRLAEIAKNHIPQQPVRPQYQPQPQPQQPYANVYTSEDIPF